MDKDTALDLALEALEGIHPGNMTPMAEEYWNKAIKAIKQARSAHGQEPVAFFCPSQGFYWAKPTKIIAPVTVDVKPLPLYTQRQWVELTDEEIEDIVEECDGVGWDVARAIKAKLKAKNTV